MSKPTLGIFGQCEASVHLELSAQEVLVSLKPKHLSGLLASPEEARAGNGASVNEYIEDRERTLSQQTMNHASRCDIRRAAFWQLCRGHNLTTGIETSVTAVTGWIQLVVATP